MNRIENPAQVGAALWALPLLATAQFLLVLDSAIVNVALPSIQRDLHLTPGGVSWVVNAYALLFGGLLLLGGRLADVVGARRVFLAGLSVFGLASVAGALAPTGDLLVTARSLQGVGASLVAPGGMALALILFEPGPARNRALGMLGAASGLGGASGAVLGGVLVQAWGWPAVLWVNFPFVAAVLVLGPRVLPGPSAAPARTLDVPGATAATVGLISLVYGLTGVAESGWTSTRTWLPLALAVMLALGFGAVERRARSPLVPSAVMGIRTLRGANAAVVLGSMAMMPMWFLLTVYLQQVRGFGPVAAGAGVLPTVVMLVLFNSLAPRIIARAGAKPPLVLGLAVAAAGLVWLSGLDGPHGGYVDDLLWPQLVVGTGFGLAFVAGTVTSTRDVPVELSGIASGLLNTAQQVGGAVGLAVLVSVASHVGSPNRVALTDDLSHGFVLAALFAALAAGLAWALLPGEFRRPRVRPLRAQEKASASAPVAASA